MLTKIVELTAAPLAVAGVVCLGVCITRATRTGRFCPGPRTRWWSWLSPWWWLIGGGCGYDLVGLHGTICPECGREDAGRVRIGRVWGWRRGGLGAVLLLMSACCWNVSWVRRGGWAKYTPTPILIGMEWVLPMPDAVRRELEGRERLMGAVNRSMLEGLAVHELGQDGVRGNADWGLSLLDARRERVAARLERALSDDDWQRRQLAGVALRERYEGDEFAESGEPSDRLLAVCVEALRDDTIRAGDTMWIGNGVPAFYFLLKHAERAAVYLEGAVGSDDEQQACLAAGVLGLSRQVRFADRCVPVLLRQLGRDERAGNARLAMPAILGFGESARVHLQSVVSDDAVERSLVRVLIRILDGEELSREDWWAIRSVTSRYCDPRDALRSPGMLDDGMWF